MSISKKYISFLISALIFPAMLSAQSIHIPAARESGL